jgi:acetyl-CoA carboxylase biotin carboxyl carrier protein
MFDLEELDLDKLIQAVERSGLTEFSLVTPGGEIRISKSPSGAPVGPVPPDAAASSEAVPPLPAVGARREADSADPPAGTTGPPTAPATPPAEVSAGSGRHPVRTPMLGVFYRSPEPGAPPFVDVGTRVDRDTTVAIIEAMKVFTSVQAGVAGIVREVLVEDRAFVEHDQALYVVEDDQAGAPA